jgi:hypothetical protein
LFYKLDVVAELMIRKERKEKKKNADSINTTLIRAVCPWLAIADQRAMARSIQALVELMRTQSRGRICPPDACSSDLTLGRL